VLVIAHHPGLQELALDLARPAPTRALLADRYPTGALATLEFSGDGWRALDRSTCELSGFMRPRELEAP
jgi:phosphohistidine phosphatase